MRCQSLHSSDCPDQHTFKVLLPLARSSLGAASSGTHTKARFIHWRVPRGKAYRNRYRQAKTLVKIVGHAVKDYKEMNADTRSKRQRLKDLVKTTRDVYIPTLSNTITHLANEATTRALGYPESDDAGVNRDIRGAQVVLYPHFTRVDNDSVYFTQAHGWVYSTEGSSRKKKIILALAKQLAKTTNPAVSDVTAGQLDEQLNSLNDASDLESTTSSASDYGTLKRASTASSSGSELSKLSTGTCISSGDDVLRERIAAFVNKSVGNAELIISVGGERSDQLTVVELLTDSNGNFNTDVATPYKPTFIQVSLAMDEKTFAFRDTIFPGSSSYAVVSDIDDTIKRTGVCGDKRSLFRNTFADNIETWEIPGAADCFRFLEQKHDVSFFYVSNSPYQLYGNLTKFFGMFEFPEGSMYLKKYSGNFLNSIMEPSHARKKAPLERIMQHFGDKKFFLIGDTSEQDLEAYVDIARLHPENVEGIYLRIAENSMSTETFKTLNDIIHKRSMPLNETPEDLHEKFLQLQTSEHNLIDLDDDETPGITRDQFVDVVKQSKTKAGEAERLGQYLEDGSNDDFFATEKPCPIHTNVETAPAPPTVVRKAPPQIPQKPSFLRSQAPPTSSSVPSSASSVSSAPPLPRRPVPTPPARSNVTSAPPPSFNSNDSLNDEETINWIGRLLTSLLVLQKVGNIRLRLFNEFADIQEEISAVVGNKE